MTAPPPSGWKPPALAAFALIAVAVGGLATAFAWAGGWLSPGRIAPRALINALERNGGVYAGYRRAHAKGICVAGHFEGNGAGLTLSRATVFTQGDVPVSGRFSTGTRDPAGPDGKPQFHSLALRFKLPGGQEWRMAMDHTPIFPVATPAAFLGLQRATTPDPATGKPDPARLQAFLAGHPETRAFLHLMATAPLPGSFTTSPYYSIDAFRFIAGDGQATTVRWRFEPETTPGATADAMDKAALASVPPDALFQDLVNRLAAGPARWRLILTVANPGDPSDDATREWTGPHREIDAGTLVLDHWQAEAKGDCRDVNFDPLILPDGIQGSDDPLLAARSSAYSVSFRRRAGEPTPPSALAPLKPAAPIPPAGATP